MLMVVGFGVGFSARRFDAAGKSHWIGLRGMFGTRAARDTVEPTTRRRPEAADRARAQQACCRDLDL